jgi:hypothetical protein
MLPDYEHHRTIAQHRTSAIREHAAQQRLIQMVLAQPKAANSLRRSLVRRVVSVSNSAARWLLNLSARLDAVETAGDQPMRRASQVR